MNKSNVGNWVKITKKIHASRPNNVLLFKQHFFYTSPLAQGKYKTSQSQL